MKKIINSKDDDFYSFVTAKGWASYDLVHNQGADKKCVLATIDAIGSVSAENLFELIISKFSYSEICEKLMKKVEQNLLHSNPSDQEKTDLYELLYFLSREAGENEIDEVVIWPIRDLLVDLTLEKLCVLFDLEVEES